VRVGSDRTGVMLLSCCLDDWCWSGGCWQGAEPVPAGEGCLLPRPAGADLEDALPGVVREAGGEVPDPVAQRVRLGFFQVSRSWRPRRRVQAVRSAAMFAAMTQPLLTCQVFEVL
jgi:hypothetical protein